jgi:hypothetical protein
LYPNIAYRLDFGPDFRTEHVDTVEPPRFGSDHAIRAPQTDADGIDPGRLHAHCGGAVATYTGWNLPDKSTGSPNRISIMVGSFIPFPKNARETSATHDSRKPLGERYADRAAYEAAPRASARKLAAERRP